MERLHQQRKSALQALARATGVKLGDPESCHWEALTGGGSDRDYQRVRAPDGSSWVVMTYGRQRQENPLYADIALFLAAIGLNVPRLIFHDPALSLVGLEDLGNESLCNFLQREGWTEATDRLYAAALAQVARLHQQTRSPVPTMPGFDAVLYHWERRYFLENLVGRWAGLKPEEYDLAAVEVEGERLAAELLRGPGVLIHRDFQSQNLMIHRDDVWLIDFQGMRTGHAAYDVASLLYDPYVDIPPARRAKLMAGYMARLPGDDGNFKRSFHAAAIQRLMQALGAYGFLGIVMEKPRFLHSIPRGLENLADALGRMGGMDATSRLVARLRLKVSTP